MRPAPAVTWLDRGVCPPEVRLPVAEARVRRDERPPVITIGIDPHKRSLTAAALDPHSRLLAELRLPATGQAAQQLLAWAAVWPQRRWAVEAQAAWAAASPSSWWPPASKWSTCRPSW